MAGDYDVVLNSTNDIDIHSQEDDMSAYNNAYNSTYSSPTRLSVSENTRKNPVFQPDIQKGSSISGEASVTFIDVGLVQYSMWLNISIFLLRTLTLRMRFLSYPMFFFSVEPKIYQHHQMQGPNAVGVLVEPTDPANYHASWIVKLMHKYLKTPLTIDLVGNSDQKLPDGITLYSISSEIRESPSIIGPLITRGMILIYGVLINQHSSHKQEEDFITDSQTNENDTNNMSSITAKGKTATSVNDLEFTELDQIDPMLDNIKIKARCISVWHSHPAGKPKQAYSFDVVLQDMKGNRIQCTARNNDMYRFEPLFQQGHCYMISDFSIGENNGILPLLNHKYKITFFQSTKVTRIDHFDEDVFGFKLEPFSDILSKKYNDKDSVDVIGAIVAIGDIIPIPNSLVKKVRRTVIIEDTEGTRVKCTFWDKWAEMFNQYVSNDAIGPVTFVLQLAKVKYFKDEPAIHNSLFGSRIFINKDIPAITSFKQRYTAKEGYSDGDHKIEVFTPLVVKMTPEIFFKQTVKSTVSGVRDLESVRFPNFY
ncbi:hypothetical protein CTI12_AA360010 [Artemisia annua]|uniref:Replication protein A 70 kDa DNA-binding subunit B/D first OB fold domain-containing protein n=1 Tax=Artemisia annua TaxID=35608 RepID=A0A2U1MN97_ARTAN|nr:hypothetical protein CTI12_AA360010 [Artemisia annua]